MLNFRLYAIAMALSFVSPLSANNGIHYFTPGCVEITDDAGEPDERAWYRREEYQEFGGNDDPTLELEEDTSWAGQREEFSDTLFR